MLHKLSGLAKFLEVQAIEDFLPYFHFRSISCSDLHKCGNAYKALCCKYVYNDLFPSLPPQYDGKKYVLFKAFSTFRLFIKHCSCSMVYVTPLALAQVIISSCHHNCIKLNFRADLSVIRSDRDSWFSFQLLTADGIYRTRRARKPYRHRAFHY